MRSGLARSALVSVALVAAMSGPVVVSAPAPAAVATGEVGVVGGGGGVRPW